MLGGAVRKGGGQASLPSGVTRSDPSICAAEGSTGVTRVASCWAPRLPRAVLSRGSLLAGPLLISLVALELSRLHEISLGVISLERIHSRSS